MPFKGQISAQAKTSCRWIFGGLNVEDSEEEEQWILLGNTILYDFSLACAALNKVIKLEPRVSSWMTDRWLTAGSWMTVELVPFKRWSKALAKPCGL